MMSKQGHAAVVSLFLRAPLEQASPKCSQPKLFYLFKNSPARIILKMIKHIMDIVQHGIVKHCWETAGLAVWASLLLTLPLYQMWNIPANLGCMPTLLFQEVNSLVERCMLLYHNESALWICGVEDHRSIIAYQNTQQKPLSLPCVGHEMLVHHW